MERNVGGVYKRGDGPAGQDLFRGGVGGCKERQGWCLLGKASSGGVQQRMG